MPLAFSTPARAAGSRLCLLPSRLPVSADDERREDLERRVSERFTRAGMEIAPRDAMEKLIESVEARSGAVYDPLTGRLDEALFAQWEADLEGSAREELGCQGFLHIGVLQVMAYYGGANAAWDGRRVMVNSGPRLTLMVLGGVMEYGWVPALSLVVEVTDLRRNEVAVRTAGIEPLQDFSLSRGNDLLPEDRWLRDEEQLEKALDSALGPDLTALKQNGRPAGGDLPTGFRWE